MAEVVRYVDPDATGAGDGTSWSDAYTSLSAWESSEQTNLVTDGDWHHVYVRSSSGTADTSTVVIDGWTTGASNYILVEAVDGDQAVKTGIDANRYRLLVSTGDSLQIRDEYVRVQGLQIGNSNSTGNGILVASLAATGSDVRINGCYLYGDGAGNGSIGINVANANANVTITNTIVYDWDDRGIYVDPGTVDVYNCIIRGLDSGTYGGLRDQSGTVTAKNVASFNNATDYDFRTVDTVDYCSSDDGTGTNSTSPSGSDWDNEFSDPANGDFTLLDTGNLSGAGVGPSTDSTVPTTDIDGTTRSGTTCDIGADEYESAGYTITAAQGSFTLTGQAANLYDNKAVDTDSGTFTLTGQSTDFGYSQVIAADSGAYTLTGQPVDFQYGLVAAAESGSFTLTGQDAGFLLGLVIESEFEAFSVTGNSANLLQSRTVSADQGSYTLTGQDVSFVYGPALSAESGSFTLTGQDLDFLYNEVVQAESGTYALTGQNTAFYLHGVLNAEPGSYTLNGVNASLLYSADADSAWWPAPYWASPWWGTNWWATTSAGYSIIADNAVFALTGQDADFDYSVAPVLSNPVVTTVLRTSAEVRCTVTF